MELRNVLSLTLRFVKNYLNMGWIEKEVVRVEKEDVMISTPTFVMTPSQGYVIKNVERVST